MCWVCDEEFAKLLPIRERFENELRYLMDRKKIDAFIPEDQLREVSLDLQSIDRRLVNYCLRHITVPQYLSA